MDLGKPSPEAEKLWLRHWRECQYRPSKIVQHYYHVLLAIVMFFLAQILTCAWDQPFWVYGLDFPGQIVAMVFLWLVLWAIQLALFKPDDGLDKFYHQYLRAPVSCAILQEHRESLTNGKYANTCFPFYTLDRNS